MPEASTASDSSQYFSTKPSSKGQVFFWLTLYTAALSASLSLTSCKKYSHCFLWQAWWTADSHRSWALHKHCWNTTTSAQLNEKNKLGKTLEEAEENNSNKSSWIAITWPTWACLWPSFLCSLGWDVLRSWGSTERPRAGEAGGNSCCTARAREWKVKEHKRADCFQSQGSGQSVRVHGDVFMVATEIPHKKAFPAGQPAASGRSSLPYIWSYSFYNVLPSNFPGKNPVCKIIKKAFR